MTGHPSTAEIVSAARVLLDALRWQPNPTPDVVEACRQVAQVIDHYDATPRFQVTPLTLAPVDHAQHLDRRRRITEAFNTRTEGDTRA